MFTFYAWMANPDLLPRAKTVTFFSERAGRSSASHGLPPANTYLPSPPTGADVVLLIHLDHYYDWTPPPQMESSFSSGVSGLSASSSGLSPGRPYPFYKRFVWTAGVPNGNQRPHPVRLLEPCRVLPSRPW
jgi:hypothetical protein